MKISSIFVGFLEYKNFKETDEKEWLDPFFQMGLYFWLHLLLFHHYFSSLIFVIRSADNDNIDNGLGSFSLIKVHIFWEGHKILQNLHLTYLWLALHRTNVRWRFCKILWPSQSISTLKSTNYFMASQGYEDMKCNSKDTLAPLC